MSEESGTSHLFAPAADSDPFASLTPPASLVQNEEPPKSPQKETDSSITDYWETNQYMETLFDARKQGKTLNDADFEHIVQPRLATFTSLQSQLGASSPLDELNALMARSAYVDAFNLSSTLINSKIKDADPFYTTPEVLNIWTVRFKAILRCLETNNDSFYQLAEAEAACFNRAETKANFFYQFFPAKFDSLQTGCFVPFALRLLAKQLTIKCHHHAGKSILPELSELRQIRATILNYLETGISFLLFYL